MSTIWANDGSDRSGTLADFNTTIGTVTSATDQAKTGPRSIKGVTGSPAANAVWTKNSVLADAGRRISFWVRMTAWAGGGDLIRIQNSSGLGVYTIKRDNTTTHFALEPSGLTAIDGSDGLTVDTWTHIAIAHVITSASNWQIKLWKNGTLIINANSTGTMTRTSADRLNGVFPSSMGTNKSCWWDDIYVDDGTGLDFPGAIRIADNRDLYNTLNGGFNPLQKAA